MKWNENELSSEFRHWRCGPRGTVVPASVTPRCLVLSCFVCHLTSYQFATWHLPWFGRPKPAPTLLIILLCWRHIGLFLFRICRWVVSNGILCTLCNESVATYLWPIVRSFLATVISVILGAFSQKYLLVVAYIQNMTFNVYGTGEDFSLKLRAQYVQLIDIFHYHRTRLPRFWNQQRLLKRKNMCLHLWR